MLNDNFKKKTVLVVEDDMNTANAMSIYLKQEEFHVLLASNGLDALQILKENQQHQPIDIVLMDLMMPDMGGFQAIELIREQEDFKNLPIFILTAREMSGDEENALKAGANRYFKKPINFEELLEHMRLFLKG